MTPALHFVGFRGEEYWSAVRVWGFPDFIHRYLDHRAVGDFAPDDIIICARGCTDDPPNPYAFNDSECF